MVKKTKIKFGLPSIPIKYIHVDTENPRYRERLILRGEKKWNEKELEKIIKESDIEDIIPSIKKKGVIEPIWVQKKKRNWYQVVEGSRRLVALKFLSSEKDLKPPEGVTYDKVQANILPKNIPQREINVRKIILQTGKEAWGPFNVAAAVYDLVKTDNFSIEEIADHWKKKSGWVLKTINNFELYLEFTNWNKEKNQISDDEAPQKYTMFQEAGRNIRDVFFQSDDDKEKFYELITPNEQNVTKIPSVVGVGGLKTLNKIIKDENIQKEIITKPTATVNKVYKKWEEKELSHKWPWIKCIETVISGMTKLKVSEKKTIKKNNKTSSQIKDMIEESNAVLES